MGFRLSLKHSNWLAHIIQPSGAAPTIENEEARAALRALNPTFLSIVKDGFRAERIDDDDETSVARDNQILTDAQVGTLLRAAREIDNEQGFEGDLYRVVVCLAATGARFAQARRMRVSDAQRKEQRLMVPGSYKGRGGNGGSVPVPVGEDVIEVLLPGIIDHPKEAPLFKRWSYEQEAGSIVWRKSERGPWKKAELTRPWRAIRERAELPEAIPYALRHSSIVRGLRNQLPIQHVAKMHNTSVKMIERHYAKYISTALDDIARAAVVPLVPGTAAMQSRSPSADDKQVAPSISNARRHSMGTSPTT